MNQVHQATASLLNRKPTRKLTSYQPLQRLSCLPSSRVSNSDLCSCLKFDVRKSNIGMRGEGVVLITVYGVLKTLKLMPNVMEAIYAMTPFYADCIKNNKSIMSSVKLWLRSSSHGINCTKIKWRENSISCRQHFGEWVELVNAF